ncbi:hypothetical protein ACQJBY_011017 [Aegilops geniculata]
MKRPRPCEDCNPQRLGDEFLAAEIVSRLPVREAARCATLSKRFRRLLTTTTDFWLRRRCLGANLPRPHVACFLHYGIDGQVTSPIPAFDFVGPALAVKRVVGSPPAMYFYAGTCNGLVLLTTSVDDGRRYIDGILFNPATRKEDEAAIRLSLTTARGVKSRRRFVGFGYGAKCKAYKVLVCVDQESINHGAVEGGGGGKLMVISFGGHRQNQNQKPRTVLFFPGKSLLCPAGLYMDDEDGKGKIYLLANIGNAGRPTVVLAFDVDDESISTIALPPGKHVRSRLMEIRGRLCACMRDNAKQNILLWALTPAGSGHRWEQLCVLADNRSASAPWTTALHGAWDCDGILFALFDGSIACMYDLREQGTGTAGVTARTRRIAVPQPESTKGLQKNFGGQFLWGYQPTLLSPEGTFGDAAWYGGGGALRRLRRSGRRNGSAAAQAQHDLPGMTDVLVGMMEKLPDGIQDLIAPDQSKKAYAGVGV